MMEARRCLVAMMTVVLLLALGACAGTAPHQAASPSSGDAVTEVHPETATSPPPGDTSGPGDAAALRIAFITQAYPGNSIVEIPYFEYDGEKNDEIDAINRLFNQGLQMRYEAFLAENGQDDDAWIEIRTYPFTNAQYAQVVLTYGVYPNLRWSGTVQSVNYDKIHNKWIQFSDLGFEDDFIRSEVAKLYTPEYDGAVIDSVNVAGFLLRPQGGEVGHFTEILLEITTSGGGVDPYTLFYAYCPDTRDFYRLDPTAVVPFNHVDMDRMNPPLYYDHFEAQLGGEPIVDGVIYTGSLMASDPGDNLSAYDAASALFHLVLQQRYSVASDYSAEKPMVIGYVGVEDIDGGECYRFEVSGAFAVAHYAVNYRDGSVYEISESGSKALGTIRDL